MYEFVKELVDEPISLATLELCDTVGVTSLPNTVFKEEVVEEAKKLSYDSVLVFCLEYMVDVKTSV